MGPGKWLSLLVLTSLLLLLPVSVSALTGDIELISPDNESWTGQNNDTMPFVFKYIDPGNATAICTLYVDDIVSDYKLAQNNTNINTYSNHDFSEGEHEWRTSCDNESVIHSANRTFFVDRTAPVVSLASPQNGSTAESGTIDFTFEFTDNVSPFANCTLFINGTNRGTNSSVVEDTETSIPVSLSDDYYEWYVGCKDLADNSNSSGLFTLDVSTPPLSLDITSPENRTYGYMDNIPLTFMIYGTPDWMGYSLDGADNVTISHNTTFDVDYEGPHYVEVYANNSMGTFSDMVYFTVSLAHEIEFVSPAEGSYTKNWILANISMDKDVLLCTLSLDGGSNVTMNPASSRSWYYNLTGLQGGSHLIDAWCVDNQGVWITGNRTFNIIISAGIIIDIKTPENRTYWGTTKVNTVANTHRNVSFCRFYLDSEGPTLMYNYSPRAWYYNFTSLDAGSYKLTIVCNDSAGVSNYTYVAFTVKSEQCESNETGICTGIQHCVDGSCVTLNCPPCNYADNHTCYAYECCSDEECLENQECVSNECADIECECGVIQNHSCTAYECCSNFHCGSNQECNVSAHKCMNRTLSISVPEYVVAGQNIRVKVVDHKGNEVEGAILLVEYPSGLNETLTTDSAGVVTFTAKESGRMRIKAEMSGYSTATIAKEVAAGLSWVLIFAVIVILIIAGGGFYYWQQMPPVVLKKTVSGKNVTLKVKNRSPEYLQNVLIMDSVPPRAFISCGVNPRIESLGNEDHLTWFAALNPGEEIAINYLSVQTADKFVVRIGDEEYESGYGFMSIIQELREKLFGRKEIVTPRTGI